MSLRPVVADPQGGPITGNGGGPMSLAKPPAQWSHVTGKRHGASGGCSPQSNQECAGSGPVLRPEGHRCRPVVIR